MHALAFNRALRHDARTMWFRRLISALTLCPVLLIPLASCGGDDDTGSSSSAGPKGSCHTTGNATGSTNAACNQCAQQQCNAEMSNWAGSGWAQHYFGGNGVCTALM